MKNMKKIAFLCIAINIVLLLQLCFGTVMALNDETAYIESEQTIENVVISAQLEEFHPIMPLACNITPPCSHSWTRDGSAEGSWTCGTCWCTFGYQNQKCTKCGASQVVKNTHVCSGGN